MTRRNAARLAWSLLALHALLSAATLISLATIGAALPEQFGSSVTGIVDQLTFLAFPIVGALIAARRPQNPIGWLFLVASLLWAIGGVLGQYAMRGLPLEGGSLPAADVAAWLFQWIWILPVVLLPPVFLLFPTGRLISRAWRWALLPPFLAGLLLAGPVAIASWEFRGRQLLVDPDSIDGLESSDVFILAALALMAAGLVAAVVSLLIRWRRSSGDERLQIKWLLAAGVVVIVDILTNSFFQVDGLWRQLVSIAAFLTVPAAVGVAILRYRLYDIDRIISRTVSYGLLIAMLGAGYLVAVLTLQSVLPLNDDSPLIVAASTLAAVAAFGPLRTGVRNVVDQRFNRSRYDVERTLNDFGARLRREVDLEVLTTDLVNVIDSTIHPCQVSVWLRSPSSYPGRGRT